MPDLNGQNVLITGSAGKSGVGVGVVEAVLEAGGTPIVNSRKDDHLAEALERYPDAVGVVGNVSEAADCARMIDEAKERVGVIHHLVNNAGIGLQKAVHETDEAEFDRLFGTDVRGMFLLTRAWLNHRLTRAGGDADRVDGPAAVVNVSSVHSQQTIKNYTIYAAAKGAVDAFTRGLAVHYGPMGVRCNAVSPGLVNSEQNEDLLGNLSPDASAFAKGVVNDYQVINDPIDPLNVGRVVVFLLSDHAASTTGQNITVDAGNTLLLFARSFGR